MQAGKIDTRSPVQTHQQQVKKGNRQLYIYRSVGLAPVMTWSTTAAVIFVSGLITDPLTATTAF